MTSCDDLRILAEAYLPKTNLKPLHELVKTTCAIGIAETARHLDVHEGFVRAWMPRRRHDNSIEPGWEPSAGFISGALARIGYTD